MLAAEPLRAGDRIRTDDNDVGNVVLYQLSYTREPSPKLYPRLGPPQGRPYDGLPGASGSGYPGRDGLGAHRPFALGRPAQSR